MRGWVYRKRTPCAVPGSAAQAVAGCVVPGSGVEAVAAVAVAGSAEPGSAAQAVAGNAGPGSAAQAVAGCVVPGSAAQADNRMDRPMVDPAVFCSEKGGSWLFLNPDLPDWIVVNPNSAVVLSRCDSSRTIQQLADDLGLPLGEVGALVAEARRRGVITALMNPPEAPSCDSGFCRSVPHRPMLRSVHLKLTNNCNLRCRYCYAESGASREHLGIDELQRVVHEAIDLAGSNPLEFTLSGGEPLLHPNALEVAECIKANGSSVYLLTNGLLIDDANVSRIAACCDMVKVSLDGASEATHALTRGKRSFDAVVHVIDRLAALGANVKVAMTVHRRNLSDVEPMAKRWGSMLTFQPLFGAGRGADKQEWALTGREYYEALASADGVSPMAGIGMTLQRLRRRGVKRCAMADAEISIAENGDVYPCQLLTSSEFRAGNIKHGSLADIFFKSEVLNRSRAISVDTLPKCRTCPIRLLCAGACRARDFYEIGDAAEVGEFCEYEQSAFVDGLFESARMVLVGAAGASDPMLALARVG
jgi:radical SAM protein with 4Fe4S-binding SPASM domain